jgi:hypothetical protein
METKKILSLVFLTWLCLFFFSCGSGNPENDNSSESSNPTQSSDSTQSSNQTQPSDQSATQNYPSQQLPEKFIAVTVFTSSSWESSSNKRLASVVSYADKAKARGLQAINLLVDWRDVETTQGNFNFDLLKNMIFEIKSRGLFCILRVFANTEDNWKAWPDWLNPTETYYAGGTKEIFPWDQTYQEAWSAFQSQLADAFASSTIQPDAIQITLGGSFGEQVLGQYNDSGWSWPTFTDKLFAAEKWHLDSYTATLGGIAQNHIEMLNSLAASIPEYEDEVGMYGLDLGVDWVQSNAGACNLARQSYGPDNAKMLARFQNQGSKIFLEDESAYWSCPADETGLSSRVEYLCQLQTTYGITFSAVSISSDHDLDDVSGIADLKNLLGI